MPPFRFGLVSNFREEASPSMLICGDKLYEHLQAEHLDVLTTRIQPAYTYRCQRIPVFGKTGAATGADKMLNRFWDYPQHLASQVHHYQAFHICDQSYSSLVHHVPAERTGVFCHDLDVFRSLLQPDLYPRSLRYNTMQRYVLNGFKKAALVFYTTQFVRGEIEQYGLIPAEKLVQVPLGIAPEFKALGADAAMLATLKESVGDRPFLLNISVTLPRKRLDVLLDLYAQVRIRHPELLLVRVGPNWGADLEQRIDHLGIRDGIRLFSRLNQEALAELYRQATLVLMPTQSEGFGMPLVEGLACGSTMVVSDIPVLREVGGDAAVYCPVGDAGAWAETIHHLLNHSQSAPPLSVRLQQAKPYTWSRHTDLIVQAYRERIPNLG